jgi:glutamyl-tRNA reductase
MHQIGVVGLSYRHVGVDEVARFSVPKTEIAARLPALRDALGVSEVFYVGTCNRVEVLYSMADGAPAGDARQAVFRALIGREPKGGEATRILRAWTGEAAVEHLFLVTCGLDSAQAGEQEIAAQIRLAWETARGVQVCGPILDKLLSEALNMANRVHKLEANVRSPSLADLAADRVIRHLNGKPATVALIGVSPMTRRCGMILHRAGIPLLVVNRTVQAAEEFAETVGGRAMQLDQFRETPTALGALVLAAGGSEPVLDGAALAKIAQAAGVIPQAPGVVPPPSAVVPQAFGTQPHAASVSPPTPGALPQTPDAAPPASAVVPQPSGAQPQAASALPPTPGARPQAPGPAPRAPGAVPQPLGAILKPPAALTPLLLDFGVPPNADPDATRAAGIARVGMDDLIQAAQERRLSQLMRLAPVRAAIDERLTRLRGELATRAIGRRLADLRGTFEQIAAEEADRALAEELSDLDEGQRELLQRFASTVARRLAHLPLAGLRAAAAHASTDAVDAFFREARLRRSSNGDAVANHPPDALDAAGRQNK